MKPEKIHRSMIELEGLVRRMATDELRQAVRMLNLELSRRDQGQREPIKAWGHRVTRG